MIRSSFKTQEGLWARVLAIRRPAITGLPRQAACGLSGVFRQSAVADVLQTEQIFDDLKRTLDLGLYARLQLFELLEHTDHRRVGRLLTLARAHRDLQKRISVLSVVAPIDPLVTCIIKGALLPVRQQPVHDAHIGSVRQGAEAHGSTPTRHPPGYALSSRSSKHRPSSSNPPPVHACRHSYEASDRPALVGRNFFRPIGQPESTWALHICCVFSGPIGRRPRPPDFG